MKKLTALLALLAVALLPAGALAKPKPRKHAKPSPRAHVYKAKLAPVPVGPYGELAHISGKAQLVDAKKNDKVSIHVRGLQPGETYLWHVHQAKQAGDPCDPDSGAGNPAPYAGWTYRTLKANAAGVGNSKGKARTFPTAAGDTGQVYYVNVHLQDGTVIACGTFRGSKKAAPKKAHKKGGKRGHKKGHAKHQQRRGGRHTGGKRGGDRTTAPRGHGKTDDTTSGAPAGHGKGHH